MHEVRFLLFLTLAAPGTAAATTAAASLFLLAQAPDGMANRKTQHRQNDDISHEVIIIEKPNPTSNTSTTAKPSLVTAQYGVKSPVSEQPEVEKAKEPEPEMDLSAVKVGATVSHKKFGEGVVAKLDDKHIYVEFKVGQKNFVFPDAFKQGFLNM